MSFEYPATLLSGDGLVLRPWDVTRDLSAIEAAASDPTIPATTSVPAVYSEVGARDWVARQHRRRADASGVVLAIAHDEGPALGMVGITGVDGVQAHGELGYWVVPSARGRGYARTGVGLLMSWAFVGLPLVRVRARVAVDNLPSRRVLEANGFALEGVTRSSLRIGDRWLDLALFARIRETPPVATTTWEALRTGDTAAARPTGLPDQPPPILGGPDVSTSRLTSRPR